MARTLEKCSTVAGCLISTPLEYQGNPISQDITSNVPRCSEAVANLRECRMDECKVMNLKTQSLKYGRDVEEDCRGCMAVQQSRVMSQVSQQEKQQLRDEFRVISTSLTR